MAKIILEHLEDLDRYIKKCITDACTVEKRDNDVKFQYMIIRKEFIFGIKTKYEKVRRRVEYRLLKNLKKNFDYNFNIVYPSSIKEAGWNESKFRIIEIGDGLPINHAISTWKLFGKEYYLESIFGNRPDQELGKNHISKLQENGYDYPSGGWDNFSDAFIKAYNMTPMDSFLKDVYPQAVKMRAAFKQYEKDAMEHGCGYWSVCDERGYACMCSPSSKVMQGFNFDVWERMKRYSL